MVKNKKIIAVIPARGNSKRLPGKNIRKIGRTPLIAYSIRAARRCKKIDRVIVSTDNSIISRISQKYGAEIIKRPKRLALDRTPILPVLKHVYDFLIKNNNYKADIIVLLQPTSPLRTSNDINRAINIFLKNKADFLVSLTKAENNPYWFFKIRKKRYIEPLIKSQYLEKRSQEIPVTYYLNGAIYIAKSEKLFKQRSFYNKKTTFYIMPRNRSIDIDTNDDFQTAKKFLLAKRNVIRN